MAILSVDEHILLSLFFMIPESSYFHCDQRCDIEEERLNKFL